MPPEVYFRIALIMMSRDLLLETLEKQKFLYQLLQLLSYI